MRSRFLAFLALFFVFNFTLYGADIATKRFNIPRGDAAKTLRLFVEQSGEQVIFLVDRVRGITTHAVVGDYTPRAALDRMLAETELSVYQDEKTSALTVNRTVTTRRSASAVSAPVGTSPSADEVNRPSAVARHPTAAPNAKTDTDAEDSVIKLPTFSVNSEKDVSYIGKESMSTTRTGVELADLPQSVVVLNKAFLNDVNPTILAKALNYLGGAQTGTISWSVDRYIIRGFVGEGDYVDGFRTQTDKNTDLNLIDRIEIIKGPSAIFIGNQANTVGGVINKISKSPTDYKVGSLTLQAGLFDGDRADLDLGGPITADKKLTYRLLLATQNSDGYYDNTYERRYSIIPMLGYNFSSDTQVWLKFEKFSSHYSSYNGLFLDGRTHEEIKVPAQTNFGEDSPLNWRTDKFWRLWGQFATRLNDHVALRVAAFDSADTQARVESIVAPTGGTILNGVLTPQYIVPPDYQAGQLLARTTTAISPDSQPRRELQNDYVFNFNTGSIRHKLLIGGDLIDYPEKTKTYSSGSTSTATSSSIDPFSVRTNGTVFVNFNLPPTNAVDKSQNFAKGYALETASLWEDRIIASFGGSRNRFAFSQISQNFNQITQVYSPVTSVPEQVLFKNLIQYGVVVKPIRHVSLFYGYNENFSSNGLSPSNTLLPPQEGRQHEFGVKSEWLDQRLNISVNYFDVTQHNNSVLAYPQTSPPSVVLVSGEISRGFDGDFNFHVSKNLDLLGSFAWFAARVPLPAPYNSVLQPYDHQIHIDLPVNNVSEHNLSAWVRYKFDDSFLRGLWVGLGVSYLARRAITDNNNQVLYGYLPARTLLDAVFGYETKHMIYQLNLDNALNQDYTFATRSNQILVPGTPINVRGSVTWKF